MRIMLAVAAAEENNLCGRQSGHEGEERRVRRAVMGWGSPP